MPNKDLESVALTDLPVSAPQGSQEFNKPLSSNVTFNSHNVADWSVGNEANINPGGSVVDVLESVVDPPIDVKTSPTLASQAGAGAGLSSCAWDEKPI